MLSHDYLLYRKLKIDEGEGNSRTKFRKIFLDLNSTTVYSSM